ncbi:MAG: proline--tRNA ligase [Nanoarchaeota archaeon]|nr:proline--tRNA ligase [Nanoarchaeota archaeon]
MATDNKGITVRKMDNFSEWYTQVIQKADLADYSSVSGCIIFKPSSYAMWEKIKDVVDAKLKASGVQNAYFPLFIPEKLLQKEAAHLEGFSPEVAWVTIAGNTPLDERLAVRPTSETIMYESYAKWIRSYHDLPLRLNQWNNVVRWEFKHPVPFLRSREFLWNEGHTCFATKKEAEAEIKEIIAIYDDVCKNILALPTLIGRKSAGEKFAGADYTISLELLMPNGRAIQGPDAHHDGQNFAKAFDITFTDQKGKKQYVWQNTWAITTRMIGVLLAIHGDDKGAVLPPFLAPLQVVIVPILFEKNKKEILKHVTAVKEQLHQKGVTVYVDDREQYSPGWKFNEWEVKGIPIRIEIGPKDVEKNQAMIVRRDTAEKQPVAMDSVGKEVRFLMDMMQQSMYKNAQELLEKNIVRVETLADAEKQLGKGKLIFAPWCESAGCETKFKEKTGAKSLNSPLEQPSIKKGQICFACKEKATVWFYFGKSY